MDKRIRNPAAAHELERISLGELIHQHVRLAIETAVHEELRAALGTNPYGKVFAKTNPKLAVYSHIVQPDASEQDLIPPTRKSYAGRVEVGEDLMVLKSEKRSMFADRSLFALSLQRQDRDGTQYGRSPARY